MCSSDLLDVFLLGEPTSALDPELVGEVERSIADAAKSGQTMILVSHDMSFVAQVADRVLFLDKGKIIEAGTPEEIIHHPKEERTKEFFASGLARFGWLLNLVSTPVLMAFTHGTAALIIATQAPHLLGLEGWD